MKKILFLLLAPFVFLFATQADEVVRQGDQAFEQNNFSDALEYYKKAALILEQDDKNSSIKKDDSKFISTYTRMANSFFKLKDYNKSATYYLASAKYMEKNQTKYRQFLIEIYSNIGSSISRTHNDEVALKFYLKALNLLDTDKPDVVAKANILRDIGWVNYLLGDHFSSINYYEKAKQFNQDVYIPCYMCAFEGRMGDSYFLYRDYNEAIKYYLQEEIAIKDYAGSDNFLIALNYQSIGKSYAGLENYPKALEYYQKALPIIEKWLGFNDKRTASVYGDMSIAYGGLGDKNKAFGFEYNRVKAIESVLSQEYLDETYFELLNKGGLYISINNYDKALKSYDKAMLLLDGNKTKEDEYERYHLQYLLGYAYYAKGDYKLALDNFNKFTRTKERLGFIGGFADSEQASAYTLMSFIYGQKNNFEMAIINSNKALDTFRLSAFESSLNYLLNVFSYTKLKDFPSAYKYSKKAFDLFIVFRDNNFVMLDSSQKQKFMQANQDKAGVLLDASFAYLDFDEQGVNAKLNAVDINNSDKVWLKSIKPYLLSNEEKQKIIGDAFNDWLGYKGSVYDSENAIASLYENAKDEELKAKIRALSLSKRELAKLYQTLPKQAEIESYKRNIAKLEAKISEDEKYISSKAALFAQDKELKKINYEELATYLKPNELYIDFAKTDNAYYIFTLNSKKEITFEKIWTKEFKELNAAIDAFRKDVDFILNAKEKDLTKEKVDSLTNDSKLKLARIYNIVFEQIGNRLKDYDRLIISPDGALRLMPFEAMFNKLSSKYLIEDKTISYIPSGKEFARLYRYHKDARDDLGIVIFSDPNFNAKIDSVGDKQSANKELDTPNTNRAVIVKSLFKMRFGALTGTKEETANIKSVVQGSDVIEFSGENASESNLLKTNSPKTLHIATHGFFINDDSIPNPMLKSGIALSGANSSAIMGKSDGIVTSLKLSGLNLQGSSLVVLSACQTGVLDANSTESVSGLNKAFIQAGANNVIMSLWSVSDNKTMELMSGFYKEVSKEAKMRKDYADALRKSKLNMINRGDHPFYWAPFIISGMGE